MFGWSQPKSLLLAYRAQSATIDSAQARADHYQSLYEHTRECNRRNVEDIDRLIAAIRHVLANGEIGKQSERRLREAVGPAWATPSKEERRDG